ncbi:MAG: hypothetical protein WCS97_03765 [Candidatus Paceibacterota bacterium]
MYVLREFYSSGIGLGQSVFEKLPTASCWSTGELVPSCYSGMMAIDNAAVSIPFYGMIIAALISAITGLIATSQVLKTHDKWWHVVTIYGVINAMLVFGGGIGIFIP